MCNNNVLLKPCRSCTFNCKNAGRREKPKEMTASAWQKQGKEVKESCPYERKK